MYINNARQRSQTLDELRTPYVWDAAWTSSITPILGYIAKHTRPEGVKEDDRVRGWSIPDHPPTNLVALEATRAEAGLELKIFARQVQLLEPSVVQAAYNSTHMFESAQLTEAEQREAIIAKMKKAHDMLVDFNERFGEEAKTLMQNHEASQNSFHTSRAKEIKSRGPRTK